jgi:hypothetical protein
MSKDVMRLRDTKSKIRDQELRTIAIIKFLPTLMPKGRDLPLQTARGIAYAMIHYS